MSWQPVKNPLDISKGDRVRGTNFTYSQKYTLMEGYEDYNCIRKGTVVSDYHTTFFDILIYNEDTRRKENLVVNPGSSGEYDVEKWIKS